MAVLACARKKDMIGHNIRRLKALNMPIAPITAKNNRREANGEMGEKMSNLQTKLLLAKGCTFR